MLALALALGGCLLTPEPYRQVRQFDLGVPSEVAAHGRLHIGDFQGGGPYRTKMVRRTGPQELAVDELNQWVQSPSALLRHRLRLAFPAPASARYRVDGEILVFEEDAAAAEAVLEVAYVIVDTGERDRRVVATRRRHAVPLAGSGAEALALAMGKAVDLLAADLADGLPTDGPAQED